jgi:hypothetical protein
VLLATAVILYLLLPAPWGAACLAVLVAAGLAELVAWQVLAHRERRARSRLRCG